MKIARSILFSVGASLALVSPLWALSEDGSNTRIVLNGAVGDGFNDDTYSFQAAVSAIKGGGTIILPEGTFSVSDTIVITKPINIVGTGFSTQIYMKGDKPIFSFQNVQNSTLRDVYLGSKSTSADLIDFFNSHHNKISNVTMLGGRYGLHLTASLLNTITDLRSGANIGGFFAPTSINNTWVVADGATVPNAGYIAANANTFIAPVLEGGTNGISLTDTTSQGSLNILGGSIEGMPNGVGLAFNGSGLPSSVTGTHFEANGKDIMINSSSNIRISAVVSISAIEMWGDTRNVSVTDSAAQRIYIDMGDGKYPLGNGAKRILLQNISTCFDTSKAGWGITPSPTFDPEFGNIPNGPSSPVLPNNLSGQGSKRRDITYLNIGYICGGG